MPIINSECKCVFIEIHHEHESVALLHDWLLGIRKCEDPNWRDT